MVWTFRLPQRENFFSKQEAGSVTEPMWKLYMGGKKYLVPDGYRNSIRQHRYSMNLPHLNINSYPELRNTCTTLIIASYKHNHVCWKYMFRNFMNSVFTGAKLRLMVKLHQMYDITHIQRRYLCFQPNLLQLYVQS